MYLTPAPTSRQDKKTAVAAAADIATAPQASWRRSRSPSPQQSPLGTWEDEAGKIQQAGNVLEREGGERERGRERGERAGKPCNLGATS